jgi:hypothetical protein
VVHSSQILAQAVAQHQADNLPALCTESHPHADLSRGASNAARPWFPAAVREEVSIAAIALWLARRDASALTSY